MAAPELRIEAIVNGELEGHAKLLEVHADYKVLRRLPVRNEFRLVHGHALARGAVVDIETTGLDVENDRLVELAVVVFEYEPATGEVYRICGSYSSLEDPGIPISVEVAAITDITDEMVAGRRLDDAMVEQLLEGVGLVIAHNAEFDRPILERRLPTFKSLPWCCSMRQVRWREEGMGATSLEHLAYRTGFFFDGHRSEVDCRALLEILRRPLPTSGLMPLRCLLDTLGEQDWRLYAVGSRYESKDKLKQRGYRWNGAVWHITRPTSSMREEINWLKAEVYKRDKVQLRFEAFDALTRFSGRSGELHAWEV
jgi:DNA polymerase-3 subunit epsilon